MEGWIRLPRPFHPIPFGHHTHILSPCTQLEIRGADASTTGDTLLTYTAYSPSAHPVVLVDENERDASCHTREDLTIGHRWKAVASQLLRHQLQGPFWEACSAGIFVRGYSHQSKQQVGFGRPGLRQRNCTQNCNMT